jgi:glutamate-1-semialdehyde 2,1-aminomutase
MSTLNCPEEVYLAEQLVQIHPWAEMVRLARTGGEANAIAVRLARAAAGRDKVAICGYHGWHDWYLAANLAKEHLGEHLLPGLDPLGVPRALSDSTLTFRYNRIEELKALIEEHPDIAAIKMEVARHQEPRDNFLHHVREIATRNDIVLIFDECSSGFRQEFGGLHKRYGVEPDLAVFGKTLGNGYAITAVIGRREIMEQAQSTFISSTFWTERVGPTAALAAIRVMKSIQSWEHISKVGIDIRAAWQNIADDHGLDIAQWGVPGLQGFSFQLPKSNMLKTFLTQEMLRKGFLANTTLYTSTAHSTKDVSLYLEALNETFEKIKKLVDDSESDIPLEGPECHTGFARLS